MEPYSRPEIERITAPGCAPRPRPQPARARVESRQGQRSGHQPIAAQGRHRGHGEGVPPAAAAPPAHRQCRHDHGQEPARPEWRGRHEQSIR